MRQPLIAIAIATTALAVTSVAVGAPQGQRDAIKAAVDAPSRTTENRARDQYRHPVDTLAFFGVQPNHTVVEIYPGGGWYTEILAPYLRDSGQLWVAAPMPNGVKGVQTMMAKNAAVYDKVRVASFPGGEQAIPDNAADVVLTFRNVHNWYMGGADNAQAVFNEAFRVLKPGGTFGVVEHRLPEDRPDSAQDKSGYMKTSTVLAFAQKAGFEVVGQSEINANPRDTADYPDGVWTLLPYLRGKTEELRAIGESDRMTIRFRKPA